MRDALIVSVLSAVPRNRVARWMGRMAQGRPSRWLTRAFVWAYDVDLSEAEVPEGGFRTLDALFTRRLRPDARPIADGVDIVVSPVDGVCAFSGVVHDDEVPVAPGRTVSLSALLGESQEGPQDVVVLYLSPQDYHRVHVPSAGRMVHHRYLPGTLWPVFPAAVRRVPQLFARNERVSLQLDTARGRLHVVMVGAFGVGRMTVRGLDLQTNTGQGAQEGLMAVEVAPGEELGCFHLGSTVVLVGAEGLWRWQVRTGDRVRVGQAIGDGVGSAPRPAAEGPVP